MAYQASYAGPTAPRALGAFDATATASAAAESEVKSQLKSGELDAAGAADAAANAVVAAAGGAAGAAACAATGAGAAVAPLCASAGAWIANEVYGPVKKFFSGIFGGESEASKFRRKLNAAQGLRMESWGSMSALQFEAKQTGESIARALYTERMELGLPPYQGWNDVWSALRDAGLPVELAQSWVDLSPTTGEWRKSSSPDPLTGVYMSEFLSTRLPNGTSWQHKVFLANRAVNAAVAKVPPMFREATAHAARIAKEKSLANTFSTMAEEYGAWIQQAREAASIVAAKNAGEAATRLALSKALVNALSAAAAIKARQISLATQTAQSAAFTARQGSQAAQTAQSAAFTARQGSQAAQTARAAAIRARQPSQAAPTSQRTVLVVAGLAAGAFLIWKVAPRRRGR